MSKIPSREIQAYRRDYDSEAVSDFMNLADKDLQVACIESNPERVVELLDQISREVSQTIFYNEAYTIVGSSKRGVKKDKIIVTGFMSVADIEVGGVRVEDFFSRSLSVEEIVGYLLARGGARHSYADVYGGLIPSLLSAPVERVGISTQDLRNSQILFENITRFREWLIEGFIEGDIEIFCRILPAFVTQEVRRLGRFVGELFINDPELVIPLLKQRSSIPKLQRSAEQMEIMLDQIRVIIFEQNPNYIPFGWAVAEWAMIESVKSEEVLKVAFDEIDKEFEDRYGEIFKIINRVRFLDVFAEESLYLRRLGVGRIRFKIDRQYDSKNITIEIECIDGFVLEAALMKPGERETDWVEAYVEVSGLRARRIYELASYLEGYLLDIDRVVNIVRKTEDKVVGRLINGLTRRSKRRDVNAESLIVARNLLSRAGFLNPLIIELQCFSFPIPVEVYYDSMITEHRRYILASRLIDVVDEDTAEILQYPGGLFYRTLTFGKVSTEEVLARYPLAMVYDIEKDTLESGWEQRSSFNSLSKTNDWQRLFTIMGNVSYVGALEYILLLQL